MLKVIKRLCLVAATLLLAACNDLFHGYQSVGGCWEQTDTLCFEYSGAEHCALDIELRSNSDYPYKEIFLRLECLGRTSLLRKVDTLVCELYDDAGRPHGAAAGILRQTTHEAGCINIEQGDTLILKVSHLMDDASLLGILDVGVRLSHCGRHQF